MTDHHPITPPPELMQQVQQWLNEDHTPLSPAAQAVLNAYFSSPIRNGGRPAVAAVLRAAATQMKCTADMLRLAALAGELEGHE